jgi:hypothetical protein
MTMKTENKTLPSPDAESLKVLEQQIEDFVVHNEDLVTLESLIGKFNIFHALRINRAEIRHSNFLAFILNPAESHGQGHLFLKPLLMDILKSTPPALRPLSPIKLDGTDLRGVDVKREREHLDLLITLQEPRLVVVIENKVDASEGKNQLRDYETKIRDRHRTDTPLLFVFLTPDGAEPSEKTWIPYSYADIYRVLEHVRTTHRNSIGEEVLVFLDHYLSSIRGEFMNDEELDELCQRIYKNHGKAINEINNRAASPESVVLKETVEVLKKDERWYLFSRRGSTILFVPKAWLDWLPDFGLDRKDEPKSWFTLRFDAQKNMNKLDFYVEVGRIDASDKKRRQIVEALIEKKSEFGFQHNGRREIKNTSTTVSGRERIYRWEKDEEPDPDRIRDAVKNKLDEISPKLQGIPDALKPLISDPVSTT